MSQHQNGAANGQGFDPEDSFSVVNSDGSYPAIVAQEVGRAIYFGRAKRVRIIGCADNLARITWILGLAPDLFDVLVDAKSLIVTAARSAQASASD
jgi:hypothetical protein